MSDLWTFCQGLTLFLTNEAQLDKAKKKNKKKRYLSNKQFWYYFEYL